MSINSLSHSPSVLHTHTCSVIYFLAYSNLSNSITKFNKYANFVRVKLHENFRIFLPKVCCSTCCCFCCCCYLSISLLLLLLCHALANAFASQQFEQHGVCVLRLLCDIVNIVAADVLLIAIYALNYR